MKYKEFWIADYVIGQAVTDDAKIRSSFDKPGDLREIHVIEHQAYSDVVKAHDEMVTINKSLQDVCKLAEKEIEKLQKQNDKMKEAFLRISVRSELSAERKTAQGLLEDYAAIINIVNDTFKEIENL